MSKGLGFSFVIVGIGIWWASLNFQINPNLYLDTVGPILIGFGVGELFFHRTRPRI